MESRKEHHHFKLGTAILIFLTLLLIFSTSITVGWNIRSTYYFVYYILLSIIILSANTLFFSIKSERVSDKVRKLMRISVAVIYIFVFMVFNLTYLFTGQITKIQTLLFILGIAPMLMNVIVFLIGAFTFWILVAFIQKRSKLEDTQDHEIGLIKKIFIISLSLFILLIFINKTVLHIENRLVTDKDILLLYDEKDTVLGSKISNLEEDYDGKNVVFILLESLSAERLGAYGYDREVSPNIDSLAKKGIIFKRAYATSTHSDYAQPAILSSRYQLVNEYRNFFDDNSPKKFLWQIFKQHDYSTGYFSSQDDRWQNMIDYIDYSGLDKHSYSMTDGKSDYGTGFFMKDYDHKTADLALDWLETSYNKPFFIYLNFQGTHNPIEYPKEYAFYQSDSKIDKYDNAVRYIDMQIGRIMDFIDEHNLTENTIFIITADHGEDLYNRHGVSGHGLSLYDDELIVPLVSFIPGVGHHVIDDRVSTIDIVPTLFDLLGFDIPKELQGTVMQRGKPLIFFSQNHRYMVGMIENDTKIIIDLNKKLIEIYDLKADPDETNPLRNADYNKQITKLMFWHFCQLEYYRNARWNYYEINRCTENNNFLI